MTHWQRILNVWMVLKHSVVIVSFLSVLFWGMIYPSALLAATDKTPTFIVVTHGQANDPFWLRVKNGVEHAAATLNVKAIYRAPEQFDMVAMSQLIEAAIQQEPDGLVISIPDSEALGDVIRKAISAGIPVASINSGEDVSRALGTLFHVGSDEFKAGVMAGEALKARGVTNPVCVNHEVGNVSLDRRCAGVNEGFGQTVKVIPSTANSVEAVYAAVKAALQADSTIDAVIALGATTVAEPTLKVMDELGRSSIALVTFDLSPAILEAIDAGRVAFAIDQQQYLQGYLPIMHLNLYHHYRLVPPWNLPSGPGLVEKSDAPEVIKLSSDAIR